MSWFKKEETDRKNKALLQTQNYKDAFSTPAGKYVLNDLMEYGHMLSPTHTIGDPCESAFRDGRRNVVLRIFQIMNTDIEKLKQIINEENEE